MAVTYLDAEVVDIIDETASVKRYFIKMPNSINFQFKAGQFVMLDLPIAAKFTNRSYSIASAPSNDNIYELCIVLKPDGLGTPYLWENIKVGSIIKSSGPLGKFCLPDKIETDLCFIATGTGIAPLRSMLTDIINKGMEHQNIYMIFGNRKKDDIVYMNEMSKLHQEYSRFNFIPVLSRETPENWDGAHGYVHPIYESLFEDKRPALFYICGWKNMLNETREKLRAMGYGKAEIKFESYD